MSGSKKSISTLLAQFSGENHPEGRKDPSIQKKEKAVAVKNNVEKDVIPQKNAERSLLKTKRPLLYENFLILSVIKGLHISEINNLLEQWALPSVTNDDIKDVLNKVPSKYKTDYINKKLFVSPRKKARYKGLAWEELEILADVEDKLSKNIQIGLLLDIENLSEVISRKYMIDLPEHTIDIYRKYLFNIKESSPIAVYKHIQRGIVDGTTAHLRFAANRPEYARFQLTGDASFELSDLVKKAGYISYHYFETCASEGRTKDAQQWANILIKAAQIKGTESKGTLMDQLEELEVEWEEETTARDRIDTIESVGINTQDLDSPNPEEDLLPEEPN